MTLNVCLGEFLHAGSHTRGASGLRRQTNRCNTFGECGSIPGMKTNVINTLRALRVFAALVCVLLGFMVVPIGVSGQAVAPRGSELLTEPLPADQTAGNAALFAGIGAFADSESGLNPLRYAPADAIALAHLFTQELKLVPPQRAWLALSYAADSLPPAAQAQLATLKTSGVNLLVADKSRILAQLSRISRMADNPDDAILVTFSSHGYEKDGQAYLMPRDGLRQHLRDTGIALDTVTATLQDSRAGKKIMIIDACRELPPGVAGGTRGDDAMSAGLQQAFIAAKGVARLISCKAQQQSWEAPDLQLGVYTHFLIEALRGRARPDERGYIRLGSVLQYASASTEAWVKRNRGREQTPWSECDEQARDIPLAVSTATREALDSLQKRRGSALELLEAARRADRERISAVMVDEVDKASRQWTGKPLDDLLDQLELLRGNTPAARANFARYWADASGAAARADETRRQAEAKQLADARRRADEAERLRKEAEERARLAEEARRAAVAAREDARPPSGDSAFSSTIVTGRNWISPATGMEFVWIEALKIWVGKHEVTNGEYRKKESGHDSTSYENHSLNGDRQPVVQVNFDDASAYAAWLTERDKAQLGGMRYRVPSEQEFTTYVQCGDGREYPWGNNWPPRSGQAGNYADQTAKRSFSGWTFIDGYDDGHTVACDVEKSWANPWGLYGVGGNVWEVCASDSSGGSFGAWRGASWNLYYQVYLRCEDRLDGLGSGRDYDGGFRLVLSR